GEPNRNADEAGRGDRRSTKPSRRRPKPHEILARYELPDRIREDVTQLTSMYDAKLFLPSIADVKHFLETRGRKIHGLKNRDQAFVRVIDLVLSLPPHAIQQLRNSAVHGGPVRLGPISDAIGSAGEALRAAERTSDD